MFLVLITILNLWASNSVIQGPDTSDIAYEKFLLDNPNKRSFISAYKQSQKNHSVDLNSLLKQAQFEFLKGSLKIAEKHFREIAEMKHESDWGSDERKTIHYALLRLYQLEKSQTEKIKHLISAIEFDSEQTINSQTFPPALVKKYRNLKSQQKDQVFGLPKNSEVFSKILVNGRKVDQNGGFIRISPGVRRLSFISNKFAPTTITSSMEKLNGVNLVKQSLAKGTCEQPEVNAKTRVNSELVLFSKTCLANIKSQKSVFKPSFKDKKTNSSSKRHWTNNKWVWIGLTVLVSGITLHHLNKNKPSSAVQQTQTKPSPVSSPPATPPPVVISNY